jgi:ligand-binding sensor domain-containing protein
LFDNNVVSIYQSIDKRLWFGSWNGLTIFNKKTRQVERHLPDPANNTAINQVPVFSIIEDDNKNIWLSASDQYIYLYREKTRDFEKYDAMTYGCYLKRIFKIPGNRFLITHYGEGVPVFDPRTKQIIDTLRKKHDVFYSVRAMIIDPNGNYWLGCDGDGISIFNPATKSSLTLRYDAYNTSSISSDGIYNLCLDSRGIVWAGTYNKGLNVYDPSIYKFELFENNLSDNASISGTPISTIYEDKHGRIWLGTDGGGLMLFDTRENTVRHYRYATDDPTSISTNTIISICEDNSETCSWERGIKG